MRDRGDERVDAGGSKKDDWKTIRSFEFPVQADLARMFLSNHGLESRLLNDKVIGIDYFLSNALGGVKLQVRNGDYILAEKLLNDADQKKYELDEDLVEGVPCVKCQSTKTEIYTKQKKYLALILLSYIGVPFSSLVKEQWRCCSCHHEWEVLRPFAWQRVLTLAVLIGLVYFLLIDLLKA